MKDNSDLVLAVQAWECLESIVSGIDSTYFDDESNASKCVYRVYSVERGGKQSGLIQVYFDAANKRDGLKVQYSDDELASQAWKLADMLGLYLKQANSQFLHGLPVTEEKIDLNEWSAGADVNSPMLNSRHADLLSRILQQQQPNPILRLGKEAAKFPDYAKFNVDFDCGTPYRYWKLMLAAVKNRIDADEITSLSHECGIDNWSDNDIQISEGGIKWDCSIFYEYVDADRQYLNAATSLVYASRAVILMAKYNINHIRQNLRSRHVRGLPPKTPMRRFAMIAGSRISHIEYKKACELLHELSALQAMPDYQQPNVFLQPNDLGLPFKTLGALLAKAREGFNSQEVVEAKDTDKRCQEPRARRYRESVAGVSVSAFLVMGGLPFVALAACGILPWYAGAIGGVVAGIAFIAMLVSIHASIGHAPRSFTLSSLAEHSAFKQDHPEQIGESQANTM